MPLYRDEAVVLRTQSLGESDRIITMLSRDHGRIRGVAKGARKTQSRFGARLEPFMVADVLMHRGRSLDTVSQAESLASYGAAISADIDRYSSAGVIAEVADRLGEVDTGHGQYVLLVGALRALAAGEDDARLVLTSYLLRATSLGGWPPSLEHCAVTGEAPAAARWSVRQGGVVDARVAHTGAPGIDEPTLALLRALLRGDWSRAREASEDAIERASSAAAAWAQWHLDTPLRSIGILGAIAASRPHPAPQDATAPSTTRDTPEGARP